MSAREEGDGRGVVGCRWILARARALSRPVLGRWEGGMLWRTSTMQLQGCGASHDFVRVVSNEAYWRLDALLRQMELHCGMSVCFCVCTTICYHWQRVRGKRSPDVE